MSDSLIESLTDELAPVRRLAHPFLRAAPWIALALAYISGVVYFLGLRPDMAGKLADPFFLFETAIMASVALSAALASSWLCVPDARGQKWMTSVPVTLIAVFIGWTALRSVTEDFSLPSLHWDHCFQDAMLMGFVPGVAMIFLSVRGATTHPFLMALMNGLAVGALGYVGLRFTCMLDTVGHSCIYHLFPFVISGALLGAAARRIFRW